MSLRIPERHPHEVTSPVAPEPAGQPPPAAGQRQAPAGPQPAQAPDTGAHGATLTAGLRPGGGQRVSLRNGAHQPPTNAELVERARRGEPGFRRLELDPRQEPALARLFAGAPLPADGRLPYLETPHLRGAMGRTQGHWALVNREASAAFAARIGPGDPEAAVAATRNNELASVLWFETRFRAALDHDPQLDPARRQQLMRDSDEGAWFDGFDFGRPGVAITRNLQADELVSDAASIATDARDLYRVLMHGDLPPDHPYAASAQLARALVNERLALRGAAPGLLDEAVRAAQRDGGDDYAALVGALGLDAEDLRAVQEAYQEVGGRLYARFRDELARRCPPAAR